MERVLVMARVIYRSVDVDGTKIFYREAGPEMAETILLLHGFPTSSHMFRNLIPLLSERYCVIAPDFPGFGQSDMPPRDRFTYTFDHIAKVMTRFTEALMLDRFVLYIFDYGAPVGLRMALAHPERVAAIVSQNGNAYEEGLSNGWNPIRAYWMEPTAANRDALRSFLKPESTVWQYTEGVPDKAFVSPDGYSLDNYYLARPGADEVQLDLFLDYASNVKMYPAFQQYFREKQPPLLATWGCNDPFFLPAGAEAFKRDNPNAQVHLLDTGHFALETHNDAIAAAIVKFLSTKSSTAMV
jgi:pimeloyl-ACP methyl ester carboxylesterase